LSAQYVVRVVTAEVSVTTGIIVQNKASHFDASHTS
jgi:hypothetical protein